MKLNKISLQNLSQAEMTKKEQSQIRGEEVTSFVLVQVLVRAQVMLSQAVIIMIIQGPI